MGLLIDNIDLFMDKQTKANKIWSRMRITAWADESSPPIVYLMIFML